MDETVGRGPDGHAANDSEPDERAPVAGGPDAAVTAGPGMAAAGGDAAPDDSPEAVETSLRTFLIADIRGYTSYTEEHGDEAATKLAARFATLVREVVEGRQGFLLELRGDEALAVFVSARQALKAANEIQRRQEIDALPRGIGIGLDAGEAIPYEGGFRGSALNLAARLCAQAGPGQIVASEAVIHLAARVDGLAYVEARTLRLKGLDEPVRAVTVVPEGRAPKRRRSTSGGPRLERRGLLAVGAVALAAVVVAAVALGAGFIGGGPSSTPSPSSATEASPTPAPSVVPGAGEIGVEDLPVMVFLDPSTGAITDTVKDIGRPVDATYADGAFWVLDLAPRAIHRIDGKTHDDSLQVSLGFDVGRFTVGGGRLWVSEQGSPVIHEFDTVSGREIDTFSVKTSTFLYVGVEGLSFGDGSLWVSHGPSDVTRVDPVTLAVQTSISTDAIFDVEYGGSAAWVWDGLRGVVRMDARTNKVTGQTDPLGGIGDLEAGGGYAWAALPDAGTVVRIDDSLQRTTIPAGAGVQFLSFDESTGMLWTGNYNDGSVTRIDTVTDQPTTFRLGHGIQPVAAGGGEVLVGVAKGPDEIVADLTGNVLRLGGPEDFFENDPAIGYHGELRMQLDQATCARLLDYPDADGTAGSVLEPSVAAAMPQVSDDGKVYTFTVRPGFAFSPPSNEPVTAETYRASIERALSPALGDDVGYHALDDVRGAATFHAGQADHIEGLRVEGDELIVELMRPSETFLQRLWLPYFCPVPIGTPAVRGGINDPPIARAGPFYIAGIYNNAVTVLRPNPNYTGPRKATLDAVAFFDEPDLGRAVARVDSGALDFAAGYGAALQRGGRVDAAWGATSPAAAAGDQRLFRPAEIEVDFLTVNPGSETLADPDVRRAVALALDRSAIAGDFFTDPTDDMFPPAIRGYEDADRFPLDGPRVDEAKALLAGRPIKLRIAWIRRDGCPECGRAGDEIVRDLAAVGIEATLEESDLPAAFAAGTDSGYDLALGYARIDYPDGAEWLREAFGSGTQYDTGAPRDWVPKDARDELDRVLALGGTEREAGAVALAARLADEMDFIPLFDWVHAQYVAERVGCLVFPQPYPFLDVVSACLD